MRYIGFIFYTILVFHPLPDCYRHCIGGIVSVLHRNEGGIGDFPPIPEYGQQSFLREWIMKSFSVYREGLTF